MRKLACVLLALGVAAPALAAGERDFDTAYAQVAAGRQLTGRAGPLVLEHLTAGRVQITDVRTARPALRSRAGLGPSLVDAVSASLNNDRALVGADITVVADDAGAVTLSGHGSLTQAARAALDAMRVPGVALVNGEVR